MDMSLRFHSNLSFFMTVASVLLFDSRASFLLLTVVFLLFDRHIPAFLVSFFQYPHSAHRLAALTEAVALGRDVRLHRLQH